MNSVKNLLVLTRLTRPRSLFLVCGSLIQVCEYWGFHVLWGFVVCIEALFSKPRSWRDGAAPPGAVADVNNTTQALMITILPAYM